MGAYIEEHAELAGLRREVLQAIADPDRVLRGTDGELLAVRTIEPGKFLVVVYREAGVNNGFVITAFVTRRNRSLDRREQVWPPPA